MSVIAPYFSASTSQLCIVLTLVKPEARCSKFVDVYAIDHIHTAARKLTGSDVL